MMPPKKPPKINFPLQALVDLSEDIEFAFWDEFNYRERVAEDRLFEKTSLYQPVKVRRPVN